MPKIKDTGGKHTIVGYGETHNRTKRSVFWELPYWRSLLLPHNLDVMHITKNCFDNVFNTIMEVKDKTKDNVNARRDIKEYCRRYELEIEDDTSRKPKACYCLDKE